MVKQYRHNMTSFYAVHPFFMIPQVRVRLSSLFECLKWLPLILLYSISHIALTEAFQRDATHIVPVNKIYLTRFGYKYTHVYKLTDSRYDPFPLKPKKVFNVYGSEKRSELILHITQEMGLTKVGQCKLIPFPYEAISYAYEKLFLSPSAIHDVWPWFISLCKEYCRVNDIKPDWRSEDDAIFQYKLDNKGKPIRRAFDPAKARKEISHATGEYEQSFNLPVFQKIPRKDPKKESLRPTAKAWSYDQAQIEARESKKKLKADPVFDAITPDYNNPRVYQSTYDAAVMMMRCLSEHELENLILHLERCPEDFSPPQAQALKDRLKQLPPEPEVDTLEEEPVFQEYEEDFIAF